MKIQLFRPKKREAWIAQLRQNGWHVQVVYQAHKVDAEQKWLLIDSAAGNWKKYAAGFMRNGCHVILLVDESGMLSAGEMECFGVFGAIIPDEEGMNQLSEVMENDSMREEIPLSQRRKQKDFDHVGTGEGMDLDPDIPKMMEKMDAKDNTMKNKQTEIVGSTPEEEPRSHSEDNHNREKLIMNSLPSMISVYGAKGGVGKTVFLLNLAALLSQYQVKVCVVDLDLYHGTVASTLHIHPELSITDLVRRIDNPKAIQDCILESGMGFSFVAAPTRYMDISGITLDSLTASLYMLKQQFDVVLIDTSSLFDDAVKAALELADLVFLMTTDEPASVKNLRKMTSLLSESCTEDKVRLIRNRVTSNGIPSEALQEYMPLPQVDSILEHLEVSDFAKRGLCLSIRDPDHPYSKQLEHWIRGWLNIESPRLIPWRRRVMNQLTMKKGGH